MSVSMAMLGLRYLWIREVPGSDLSIPMSPLAASNVLTVFRCVVSKRLQVLFRDGLLPVCGVPLLHDGDIVVRRYGGIFLVRAFGRNRRVSSAFCR